MLQPNQIERALVITAHPDDVDFSSAGVIAHITDAGGVVTYCLVTDGQAGGFDQTIERDVMAATRREEQTKAAAEVGVNELIFLGHPDGSVEFTLGLRRDLTRVIRQVRPQVVIGHAPMIEISSVYGSHADHVATGQATWAAVYPDAGNPFAFPELLATGCEPWSVSELWVMNVPDANETVDITSQIDRKIRALRCHASQHRDPDGMEERVRTWFRSNASLGGLPEGTYAERFFVASTG